MTHMSGKQWSHDICTAVLRSAAPGRQERRKMPSSLSPTLNILPVPLWWNEGGRNLRGRLCVPSLESGLPEMPLMDCSENPAVTVLGIRGLLLWSLGTLICSVRRMTTHWTDCLESPGHNAERERAQLCSACLLSLPRHWTHERSHCGLSSLDQMRPNATA